MVKLLDFIDGLVTEVRFRTKSVKHKQIQQQQHQKLYLHDHKGITVLQKLLV